MIAEALQQTAALVGRVLPIMFISLFGVELLVQLGVMRRVEPLGRPLARVAHLPPQAVVTFMVSVGSLIAANTMLAQYHEDGRISGRELVLGAVFNTVPIHFKETLTYQVPVVLPLLGWRLCLVYVAVFWLSGLLKLAWVVAAGRRTLEPRELSATPLHGDAPVERPRGAAALFRAAWGARAKLFVRMAGIIVGVTFLVQLVVLSGVLRGLERAVGVLAGGAGFPEAVVAPTCVYIVSPIVGITSMSTLLQQGLVAEYHAIVALLVGGFLMVPVTRLRGTMPRYVSILGLRHGMHVLGVTTTFSLVSRAIVLVGVLAVWPQ
ncbi:MAG: hypothetical protein ACLFOY_08700 [Desulfatibacillaceae bacterium]